MPIEITIPRLGWSMDEGTFGEWVKSDGEFVAAGEAIFTLESDKALQEVESVDEGILRIIPEGPQEGDTVTVGTLVAWLLEDGEDVPAPADPTCTDVKEAPEVPATQSRPHEPAAMAGERPGRHPAISPRALRLARELGIDWSQLKGTGRNGRIRERDVQARVATSKPGVSATRRLIADRMMTSVRNTAPVTLTTRVDATNLLMLREQYKARTSQPVPTLNDVIIKLCAVTLRELPDLNFQWTDNGPVDPGGIHIGLAVDTQGGLVVPVIRDAHTLPLLEVAERSRVLIDRAFRRECTAAELGGGTFSITNLGQFGIETFTPILNPPQTAILGLGEIRREAVVLDDDRIAAQHRLPLSLTFDHRVVDGAPAARFLQQLGSAIENPGPYLIQ